MEKGRHYKRSAGVWQPPCGRYFFGRRRSSGQSGVYGSNDVLQRLLFKHVGEHTRLAGPVPKLTVVVQTVDDHLHEGLCPPDFGNQVQTACVGKNNVGHHHVGTAPPVRANARFTVPGLDNHRFGKRFPQPPYEFRAQPCMALDDQDEWLVVHDAIKGTLELLPALGAAGLDRGAGGATQGDLRVGALTLTVKQQTAGWQTHVA